MLGTAGHDLQSVRNDSGGFMAAFMALLASKKEGKELWAVLIFIVFVIIILIVIAVMFTRDRRGNDGAGIVESVIPLIATSMVNNRPQHNGYDYNPNYMIAHDGQRDNLKEFGQVKQDIVVNRYETAKEVADAKFETYKAIKESEEKQLLFTAEVERRAVEREDRRKDAELAFLKFAHYTDHRRPVMGNYANIQQIDAMGYGGYAFAN
jgi:hypothetical protein